MRAFTDAMRPDINSDGGGAAAAVDSSAGDASVDALPAIFAAGLEDFVVELAAFVATPAVFDEDAAFTAVFVVALDALGASPVAFGVSAIAGEVNSSRRGNKIALFIRWFTFLPIYTSGSIIRRGRQNSFGPSSQLFQH